MEDVISTVSRQEILSDSSALANLDSNWSERSVSGNHSYSDKVAQFVNIINLVFVAFFWRLLSEKS